MDKGKCYPQKLHNAIGPHKIYNLRVKAKHRIYLKFNANFFNCFSKLKTFNI